MVESNDTNATNIIKIRSLSELLGKISRLYNKRFVRYAIYAPALLFLLWVIGVFDSLVSRWSELDWYIWRPQAKIFVESPEVYTRERLINERLAEEEWLNSQLEAVDGNRDAASLYKSLTDSVFVAANKPSEGGVDSIISRDGELSAVEAAKLGQSIDQLSDFPMSFDQNFRLKSAHRNLVRQRIIENRLDDRHDLEGNALYILKFDTTVVGVPFGGGRAVIEVEIKPPSPVKSIATGSIVDQMTGLELEKTYNYTKNNYYDWIETLESRINENIFRYFRGLYDKSLMASVRNSVVDYLSARYPHHSRREIIAIMFGGKTDVALEARIFLTMLAIGEITGDPAPALMEYYDFQLENRVKEINAFGAEDAKKIGEIVRSFPVTLAGGNYSDYVVMAVSSASGTFLDARVTVVPRETEFVVTNADCETLYPSQQERQAEIQTTAPLFRELKALGKGFETLKVVERASDIYSAEDVISKEIVVRALKAYEHEKNVSANLFRIWDIAAERGLLLSSANNDKEKEAIRSVYVGPRSCEKSTGITVDLGLINFVRRIGEFNTYSYSVLPRESAISVFGEVFDALAATSDVFGIEGARRSSSVTRKWSLRPVITTFGDTGPGAGLADSGALGGTDELDESDEPVVGWLIDLAAREPDESERFEMTSVSESVLAIISVPAWWSEIELFVRRGWLDGNQEVTWLTSDSTGNRDQSDFTRFPSHSVKLPNKPELLDTLLLDSANRRPIIVDVDTLWAGESASSEAESDFGQPCEDISLLILGPRLWRNTLVTLGGIKAHSIEVTPDMEGIVARLKVPAKVEDSQGKSVSSVKLRVWTSEGVAEFADNLILQRDGAQCSVRKDLVQMSFDELDSEGAQLDVNSLQ
ncbi:hypothetical protein [Bauldia sp.]|uniref:hypothetical protein n=1 Tax=Bauldia sp. TaxID=2575872 RepID=UPI003BA87FD6